MKQIALGEIRIDFYDGQIAISADGEGKFSSLMPELPLVRSAVHDDRTVFALPGRHIKITCVRFMDGTDRRDFLVRESTEPLYQSRYYPQTFSGTLFLLDSYLTGEALIVLSEAAPYAEPKLTVSRGEASLSGCGYGAVYGYCRTCEARDLIYRYYRLGYPGEATYILSNTWGGEIRKERLCEEFMLREIDRAAELGVDVVQIDADWQKGDIFEAVIRDGKGDPTPFKRLDGDFWQVDADKFPHGLRYLADYAGARGIALGIWFAPDCRDGMKNRERDLSILRYLYDCGIRYFKLDMVSLETPETERRYLEFLHMLSGFGQQGDGIRLNLDITDGNRTGYFLAKEAGTLFVENRYTHMANYYPHNTLKNLWMLSAYFPPDKFQFEIMDCRKNAGCYPPDDPLAPANYDMDYLFASVMLANPLFWMSMQALEPQDVLRLRNIIGIYKAHRAALHAQRITPLGDMPDGASFCGFSIGARYLLLFREWTRQDEYVYRTVLPEKAALRVLASNAEVVLSRRTEGLSARFSRARAFAFIQIEAEETRLS